MEAQSRDTQKEGKNGKNIGLEGKGRGRGRDREGRRKGGRGQKGGGKGNTKTQNNLPLQVVPKQF